ATFLAKINASDLTQGFPLATGGFADVNGAVTVIPPSTDSTPPATTAIATPTPNANGWNNSNVTVALSSVDNPGGSGVKQITIALNGAQPGSAVVPGDTTSVSLTVEGITTVTYFGTDNAGNQEAAKTLTLKIDKTPPAISGLPIACTLSPPNH